jgi:hypothetical protein
VNGWKKPIEAYWPAGSKAWTDNIAVETPLVQAGEAWSVAIGPFLDPAQPVTEVDFVFHGTDGSWGKNEVIPIAAECTPIPEPAADKGPEPVAETPPESVAEPVPDAGSDAAMPDTASPDPGPGPEPVPDLEGGSDSGKADVQKDRGGSTGCHAGSSGASVWWWLVLLGVRRLAAAFKAQASLRTPRKPSRG